MVRFGKRFLLLAVVGGLLVTILNHTPRQTAPPQGAAPDRHAVDTNGGPRPGRRPMGGDAAWPASIRPAEQDTIPPREPRLAPAEEKPGLFAETR